MLVIAAPGFSAPSETFVRNHVRTIAPGETALLCLYDDVLAEFDGPSLKGLLMGWQSPGPIHRRFMAGLHKRLSNRFRPGLLPSQSRRVVSFLDQIRPAAVLAEYGPTGCYLLDSCKRADVPLYVHFHGYDASSQLRVPGWRKHYERLFRSAAGIITPSRFLKEQLTALGCPESLLHVCPCGVDPKLFGPTSRMPGEIVAVGRLVPKKAPHLTIAAFARVAQRFPQVRLRMIGDGPLMEHCRHLIAELGLHGQVSLHGAQDAEPVSVLMGRSSLFVQHSVTAENGDTEGLPVAVLEAMAAELPVISTRHAGIPEAVVDSVTGLLVDEHDVDAMAAAMAKLLDDPLRAEQMGKAGRQRVLEGFTLEKTNTTLRAILGLSNGSADTFGGAQPGYRLLPE